MMKLRRANNIKGDKLPVWLEPSSTLNGFLQTMAIAETLERTESKLHFSNLLKLDKVSALEVSRNRTISDARGKSTDAACKAIATLTTNIIIWAPESANCLGALCSGLLRYLTSPNTNHNRRIFLVCPIRTRQGATEFHHMTDIWTHAVLNNKWGMLRISTQFMAQPDQRIVTAGLTPRSQIRSFCLVQLGLRRAGNEERKGALL